MNMADKKEVDIACAVARAGWITDKPEVCLIQDRIVVEKFIDKANRQFGEKIFSLMEIEDFAKLRGYE